MIKQWLGDVDDPMSGYGQIVTERVTMSDVIGMYVPSVHPRRNRIPCPIHNGEDYNMSFNDYGFCCFVCGAHGGVIRFVMDLFGVGFVEAIQKLNRDFCLGLPFDRKITVREQAQYNTVISQLQAKRDKAMQIEREKHDAHWKLMDEWIVLDKIKRYYKPTSPDDPVNPFWHYAVNRIGYIQYLLDCEL